MIQVTPRMLRLKLTSLFDLADNGEKIIIRRGKKRAYALVPVDDDDLYLSPETEEQIKRSREQYRNGEFTTCETAEEAIKFLESL